MKFDGRRLFSRTIRRTASVLRLRRGRIFCSTHGRPNVFARSTPEGTCTRSSPSHTEPSVRSRLAVATTAMEIA